MTRDVSCAPILLPCAASIAVVTPWIAQPHLRYDDFGFLTADGRGARHAPMRRVERVDRYCRLAAIDGETARQALPFVHFPLGYPDDNAWDFLRGGPSTAPASVEALQAIR